MIKEKATVDAPGVNLYHSQKCVLAIHFMMDVERCLGIYNIHIGVGSNVVRSIISGNARALNYGTDNRQFPRSFILS